VNPIVQYGLQGEFNPVASPHEPLSSFQFDVDKFASILKEDLVGIKTIPLRYPSDLSNRIPKSRQAGKLSVGYGLPMLPVTIVQLLTEQLFGDVSVSSVAKFDQVCDLADVGSVFCAWAWCSEQACCTASTTQHRTCTFNHTCRVDATSID
jgi:hypothetical protein